MAPLDGIEAIVLAGGKGSRMAARFPGIQKVCLPVAGRPFFHHVVAQLAANGCRRVVLAAGHLASQVEAAASAIAAETGIDVALSEEPEPSGTGGATALAAASTGSEPILVTNGDSLSEVDFAAFVTAHQDAGAHATLAVTPVAEPGRFGNVEFGTDGWIVGFREKAGMRRGESYVSCGVYLLSRAALDDIAAAFGAAAGPLSLERDVFPTWVGDRFLAYPATGPFIDIGVPESHDAANGDATKAGQGEAQ